MDYLKHYNNLIENSKNRNLEGYYETHHILPKCLGGTDDAENLSKLTAREHFIAHQLLIKIYPNEYKLVFAAKMMCIVPKRLGDVRANNRLYGWLRTKLSEATSKSPRKPRKKETKPRNRVYTRTPEQSAKAVATRKANGYKHSEETKSKIREGNLKTKSTLKIVAWNKGLTKEDPRVANGTSKMIQTKLSKNPEFNK